jgi:hypothetical protein
MSVTAPKNMDDSTKKTLTRTPCQKAQYAVEVDPLTFQHVRIVRVGTATYHTISRK